MRDLGPSCFTEGPVRYWSQKGKLGFAPRPVRPQSRALCKAPVNPNPVWPPGPDSAPRKGFVWLSLAVWALGGHRAVFSSFNAIKHY